MRLLSPVNRQFQAIQVDPDLLWHLKWIFLADQDHQVFLENLQVARDHSNIIPFKCHLLDDRHAFINAKHGNTTNYMEKLCSDVSFSD